jgi:hypothetical protein
VNAYCLVTFLHDDARVFVIDQQFFTDEAEALQEKHERITRNNEYKFTLMSFKPTDARLI